MRLSFFLLLLLPTSSWACTAFKVTQGGRTMVGNNEDAWSLNARIRFERGGPGEFGAVYLGHFNGHPFRSMTDQGGMNEAGLMFDGLVVPAKTITTPVTRPLGEFGPVLQRVMRTCADVQEAAAVFRTYDMRLLTASMIWLVDRKGGYLVVESDTLFIGHDPVYAVGNFRASSCSDFGSVPIPRYQQGRALLASGADTTLAYCTEVMHAMQACRKKLGEGTLYTDILDLDRGIIHIYFHHDFTERRTFDLKEELAKGDHTLSMPELFGPNAEYERLQAFVTPFHQRGLFWALVTLAAMALGLILFGMVALLRRGIARMRGKGDVPPVLPLFILMVACMGVLFLLPFLLFQEGVYYFGLADAMNGMPNAFAYVPLLLCVLLVPLVLWSVRYRHRRSAERWVLPLATVAIGLFVGLLCYWGMVPV